MSAREATGKTLLGVRQRQELEEITLPELEEKWLDEDGRTPRVVLLEVLERSLVMALTELHDLRQAMGDLAQAQDEVTGKIRTALVELDRRLDLLEKGGRKSAKKRKSSSSTKVRRGSSSAGDGEKPDDSD